MNDIYLIRHTTPAVARGICYGQTDLDVTESFFNEAAVIRRHLPAGIAAVHSSPLRRCALLAQHLFPEHTIRWQDELKEVHCGEWEMKIWDELPREQLDPWMADFVNIRIPGGESYLDLQERVMRCWDRATAEGTGMTEGRSAMESWRATEGLRAVEPRGAIALVAHGGVIRSILSGVTGTPLIDSFKTFSLHYGCVVRVYRDGAGWGYEMLSNVVPPEREQHKPKSFY